MRWPGSTWKRCKILHPEHQSLYVTPFGPLLHRRHIVETLIGSLIVVISVPLLGYTFQFLYASEDVRVKNSPSVTVVESFYVSSMGRAYRIIISFPLHHSWKSLEMNSEPLSHLIFSGLLSSQIIFSLLYSHSSTISTTICFFISV